MEDSVLSFALRSSTSLLVDTSTSSWKSSDDLLRLDDILEPAPVPGTRYEITYNVHQPVREEPPSSVISPNLVSYHSLPMSASIAVLPPNSALFPGSVTSSSMFVSARDQLEDHVRYVSGAHQYTPAPEVVPPTAPTPHHQHQHHHHQFQHHHHYQQQQQQLQALSVHQEEDQQCVAGSGRGQRSQQSATHLPDLHDTYAAPVWHSNHVLAFNPHQTPYLLHDNRHLQSPSVTHSDPVAMETSVYDSSSCSAKFARAVQHHATHNDDQAIYRRIDQKTDRNTDERPDKRINQRGSLVAEQTQHWCSDSESGDTLLSPAASNDSECGRKASGKDSFFWQYNVHSKGPKGRRVLAKQRFSDPFQCQETVDPVFSSTFQAENIKHRGKARRGDGNDLTPRPHKLLSIRADLDRLNRVLCRLGAGDVSAVDGKCDPRREKNKIASRACRLKKKAQHEANKIQLSGLQAEHNRLMSSMREIFSLLKRRVMCGDTHSSTSAYIEQLCSVNEESRVAGRLPEYVQSILSEAELLKAHSAASN